MKLFTVEEANQLLPQVREILLKVRLLYRYISVFKEEAQNVAKSAEAGGGGMIGGSKYVTSLYEIGKLTSEIDELEVQIKDYERGLIDFPSMRDGRIVLLCWQLDEGDEILWWHDIEAGFAGRKRI